MSVLILVNPGGTPADSTPAQFKAATNADGSIRWIYCQLNMPPTVTALRNRMDADTKLFGNLGWYYHIVTGPQSAKQPLPSNPSSWAQELALAAAQLGAPITYAIGNELSSVSSGMTATQAADLHRRAYDALHSAGYRVTNDGLSFESWVMCRTFELYQAGQVAEACALYNAAFRHAPPPLSQWPLSASNIGAWAKNPIVNDPLNDRGVVQFFNRILAGWAFDAFQVHWYGPSDVLSGCLDWLAGKLPRGLRVQFWEHGLRVKTGYPYDQTLHARYAAENLTRMLAARARDGQPLVEAIAASPFCAKTANDTDEFKPYANYQSYALRPAGVAFQQVVQQVQGGSAMTQVDVGDARVLCYWFTDGTGQKVYVVWTTGETISVPLGAGATITAIDGTVSNIPVTVQAGPSPMFVRLG